MTTVLDNTKATIENSATDANLAFDASVVPGASYFPIYTTDGRIPQVLGRNKAAGGADVFENGATFAERTETLQVNNKNYSITVLDITHS